MFLATNKGKCVICIGNRNIIPGGNPVELTKLESDHPEIQSHVKLGDLELIEVDQPESANDDEVTLDNMTLAQLKECAAGNKIDLGQATKKEDIIAIIKAAEPGK